MENDTLLVCSSLVIKILSGQKTVSQGEQMLIFCRTPEKSYY